MMYWMNDQVCLGEVELATMWVPEWGNHACRVRAIDPLVVPDGAVLARPGEYVITTWKHLRSRDEDLAVVEAFWLVNGVTD